MRFRGGRGGRGRGGISSGGGFRTRGGGGRRGQHFSNGKDFNQGPPEMIMPLGYFDYPCQGDLICKGEIEDVPYFNAPVYLRDKECVGKIDEIFGNLRDYYVSIKLNDNVAAKCFEKYDKLFINPEKILPLKRFLPQSLGTAKRGGVRSRVEDHGRGRTGWGITGEDLRREGGSGFRARGGGVFRCRSGEGVGYRFSKGGFWGVRDGRKSEDFIKSFRGVFKQY